MRRRDARSSAASARRGLLAALVAAGFGMSCGRDSGPSMRDIVLVTIDTLRADHLGLYGYPRGTTPHIDRWFQNARIVENSFSAAASTPPSVVSFLSGVAPRTHQIRQYYQLLSPATELLTDLLPSEYSTAAFVSNIVLTDEALGLADRFDHFDDFVDEREPNRAVYERTARRTTNAALDWVTAHHDPERPLFLWVHYIDPHGPYLPPADWPHRFRHTGSRPVGADDVPDYVRDATVTDGWEYVDRYDDEIRYVDQDVGRLLRALDAELGLDDALVMLTSDHGESLMDHEKWFRHGHHVYDEVVRVPLLIREPGHDRAIERGPSTGIDVVPTILAFAGARDGIALAGRSWLGTDKSDGERVIETEATSAYEHWKAVLWSGKKLMRRYDRPAGTVAESRFYDLRADPLELAPRPDVPDFGSEVDSLVREWTMDPYLKGPPPGALPGRRLANPKISPRADADAIERLRALGYVE